MRVPAFWLVTTSEKLAPYGVGVRTQEQDMWQRVQVGRWRKVLSNGVQLDVVANRYPGGSSAVANFGFQVYDTNDDVLHESGEYTSTYDAQQAVETFARECGWIS